MKLKIKKLDPQAKLPQFALVGDVGMDIFSNENLLIKPGERVFCKTGIAMEFETDYTALIWDKGGMAFNGIKTMGGVFEGTYHGEYLIGLVNLGQIDFEVKQGQKIAQVLFQKVERPQIEEVAELSESSRGEGRFGSTGKF